MIVKDIDVYHEPAVGYNWPGQPPRYPVTNYQGNHNMGKLEYAMFLKTLETKVGDLVISKYQMSPPRMAEIVHRVVSIDEVHRFVEFGGPGIGPKCFNLQSVKGGNIEWKGGAILYRKLDPKHYPPEWIEILEKEKNASPSD